MKSLLKTMKEYMKQWRRTEISQENPEIWNSAKQRKWRATQEINLRADIFTSYSWTETSDFGTPEIDDLIGRQLCVGDRAQVLGYHAHEIDRYGGHGADHLLVPCSMSVSKTILLIPWSHAPFRTMGSNTNLFLHIAMVEIATCLVCGPSWRQLLWWIVKKLISY